MALQKILMMFMVLLGLVSWALEVHASVAGIPAASGTTGTVPVAATSGIQIVLRSDIPSSDIDCGQGRTQCRSCGDVATVVAACQANPSCVAFSYDNSCGYLKSAAGPTTYREGYTVYVLSSRQPAAGSTGSTSG